MKATKCVDVMIKSKNMGVWLMSKDCDLDLMSKAEPMKEGLRCSALAAVYGG